MVAVHAGIENWSLCKKLCKSSFIFDVLQSFFFFLRVFLFLLQYQTRFFLEQ